jgi:hypothetical protein
MAAAHYYAGDKCRGFFLPFFFRPPAQLPDCPGEVVVDWLQWNIPRRAGEEEGVCESRGSLSDRMRASIGCSSPRGFYCWYYSVICSEMWRAGDRWLGSAVGFVSWRWSRGRRRSGGTPGGWQDAAASSAARQQSVKYYHKVVTLSTGSICVVLLNFFSLTIYLFYKYLYEKINPQAKSKVFLMINIVVRILLI